MKYYVKKTGEAFHSEMAFDELQAGFKTRRIAPDWSVRREDDGDYDWVTVQQLCVPGRTEPSAREILDAIAANSPTFDPTGQFVVVFGVGLALMVFAPSVRSLFAPAVMALTVYFSYKKGFNPWFWVLAGGIIGLVCLLVLSPASEPQLAKGEVQKRRRAADIAGGIISALVIVVIAVVFLLYVG